jgi:flagellar protein FliO/FliZ
MNRVKINQVIGKCALPWAALSLISTTLHAAEPEAVGRLAYEPMDLSSLTQVALALLVVVVAIVTSMWLLRRLNDARGSASGRMSILCGLNVGAKEKIMLVQCGDKNILVGVTAGSIQTLHVFEVGEGLSKPSLKEAEIHPFAHKLTKLLKQGGDA